MKVLALSLVDQVLVLALARQVLALALALREKSWPWPCHWPRLFLQDPGHLIAVRVCSAHTHSVT